jgi:hypothetical protein
LLKEKYDLESYYQVLITLSEEKSCIDPELVEDLHTTYQKLLKEPKNNLEQSLPYYINKQYEFDAELRKECEDSDNETYQNTNESLEENTNEENTIEDYVSDVE